MAKVDWKETFLTFIAFSIGIIGIFGVLTTLTTPNMPNKFFLFLISSLAVGFSLALLKELFDV